MSAALAYPPPAPSLDGRLMTEPEFLALPDDGVERWLIDGEVREFGTAGEDMTVRNRVHSVTMARIATFLTLWLDTRPDLQGEVLCGEAGVRLESGELVGVDVAYVPPEPADTESSLVTALPVLVAEILSPSDTTERVDEKLDVYRQAGVPVLWLVDPHDRTVTVYRPETAPVLFNETQDLTAEPHLPGFRVRVADLFGRSVS